MIFRPAGPVQKLAAAALISASATGAAEAQTIVDFQATIVPTCILAVGTSGVMTMSATGTEIGSEQSLGSAASLQITATGGAPTISFSAPAMNTKPVAYTGTPAVAVKYSSAGGANQAYTSEDYSYTSTTPLGDTVTLHARAQDQAGFVAGTYNVRTTATCQG